MMLLYVAAQVVAATAPMPVPTGSAPMTEPVQGAPTLLAQPPARSTILTLAQDTPIELMATAEVNTDDAKPGTIFKLRVNKAVEQEGRIVVPVGAPAFGQVITATDAGGLGKSGRMTARLLHLRLGDAEVPLEGQTSAKGASAGSAGVAFLFSGVMGLFHRGNNAKIKAGEILSGYVARDVALDLSGPITRGADTSTTGSAVAPVPAIVVPTAAPSTL